MKTMGEWINAADKLPENGVDASARAAGLLSALICTVMQLCRGEAGGVAKAAEDARFELVDSYEDISSRLKVYVDRDTGVQYLVYIRVGGHGAGVIAMVDADGKPLVKGEDSEAG